MIPIDDDLRKAITDKGLYLSSAGTTDDRPHLWAFYLIVGAIYNEHTQHSYNNRDGELERIIEFAEKKRFVLWDNPP